MQSSSSAPSTRTGKQPSLYRRTSSGHCPRCGSGLEFSPSPKILYQCSNYECDFREYMYPYTPKGGKAKGGKMNKSRAIQLCLDNGIPINQNICTFSTQNQGHNDWWLILNDIDRRQLYLFLIPAGAIKRDEVIARVDRPYQIDLQIYYNDHHHPNFTDSRSGIEFKRWLVRTIQY